MPQLEPELFPSQLFWLVLTFVTLYLILWKVALPRVTDVRESRRGRIEADLERAEALKTDAEAALADYEKTIAEATAKAQEAVRAASRDLAEKAEKQRHALAEKLNQQMEAAEQRIAEEKARAIGEIGEIAGELTQAAAGRLVGTTVSREEADAAVAAIMRESA